MQSTVNENGFAKLHGKLESCSLTYNPNYRNSVAFDRLQNVGARKHLIAAIRRQRLEWHRKSFNQKIHVRSLHNGAHSDLRH